MNFNSSSSSKALLVVSTLICLVFGAGSIWAQTKGQADLSKVVFHVA